MNRKVLLISNPGESGADNYCEGVNKDVENYKQFLLSSEGGAWYSNEIVHLERPFVYQVEEELEKIKFTDYSMVIFCGHGYVNHSSDTILELRKNIEISSEKFRAYAVKRTVILDCCRKVELSVTDEQLIFAQKIEKSAMVYSDARKFYEEMISRCPNSLIVMYACNINETAGDDSMNGGYYSYNLLRASRELIEQSTNKKECLNVVSAHNVACQLVKAKSGGNQNPQIEKPRSGPYFPFAVKV